MKMYGAVINIDTQDIDNKEFDIEGEIRCSYRTKDGYYLNKEQENKLTFVGINNNIYVIFSRDKNALDSIMKSEMQELLNKRIEEVRNLKEVLLRL